MAFNLSEFQAQIGKHGLARSNVFMFRITKIPAFIQSEIPANELVFFCKGVDLPSLTLLTEEYYAQGFGARERRPTGLDLPLLPTTFFIDSSHKILKFFHAWMQAIVNYDVEAGILSEVDGRVPFEYEYRDNYIGEAEVLFYSPNYPDKYYTYKFHNIHPIEVGTISLAWESNDELAILPVSFSYDTVKLDGSRSGNVITDSNIGPGLLDYIYGIANQVQAIKGITKPRSIQDAINVFSTISRIF